MTGPGPTATAGVPSVRSWETGIVTIGSRAAMLVVLGSALIEPSIPIAVQVVPLAASLVLLGVPHGAVDHLAGAWAMGRVPSPRDVATVTGLYVALMAAYLAVWLVAPSLAFVLFITLTLYHWGQGDLYWLLAADGAPFLRTRAARVRALLVRGSLPMIVPLLAAPAAYRAVADATTGVIGGTVAVLPGWAGQSWFRLVAGAVLVSLLVASLALDRAACRPGELGAWRRHAADTALLATTFAVAPPILAVGVYFCGWHAPRHLARMARLGPDTPRPGQPGRSLRGLMRVAAVPTVAALILLVALGLLTLRPSDGWLDLVGVYLVGLALLTLPHTVIVTWLDLRQGIWGRSARQDGRPFA